MAKFLNFSIFYNTDLYKKTPSRGLVNIELTALIKFNCNMLYWLVNTSTFIKNLKFANCHLTTSLMHVSVLCASHHFTFLYNYVYPDTCNASETHIIICRVYSNYNTRNFAIKLVPHHLFIDTKYKGLVDTGDLWLLYANAQTDCEKIAKKLQYFSQYIIMGNQCEKSSDRFDFWTTSHAD